MDCFTVEDTALSGGEIVDWVNRRRSTVTSIRWNREINGCRCRRFTCPPSRQLLTLLPSADRAFFGSYRVSWVHPPRQHSKAHNEGLASMPGIRPKQREPLMRTARTKRLVRVVLTSWPQVEAVSRRGESTSSSAIEAQVA